MLLNLEDCSGKTWRFRYSYWNSSQSYVLTKGWSRFVKEKNLKAGDIVSFQRSTGQDKQLYIGWKSRSSTAPVMRLFGVTIAKSPNIEEGKKRKEAELSQSQLWKKRFSDDQEGILLWDR